MLLFCLWQKYRKSIFCWKFSLFLPGNQNRIDYIIDPVWSPFCCLLWFFFQLDFDWTNDHDHFWLIKTKKFFKHEFSNRYFDIRVDSLKDQVKILIMATTNMFFIQKSMIWIGDFFLLIDFVSFTLAPLLSSIMINELIIFACLFITPFLSLWLLFNPSSINQYPHISIDNWPIFLDWKNSTGFLNENHQSFKWSRWFSHRYPHHYRQLTTHPPTTLPWFINIFYFFLNSLYSNKHRESEYFHFWIFNSH